MRTVFRHRCTANGAQHGAARFTLGRGCFRTQARAGQRDPQRQTHAVARWVELPLQITRRGVQQPRMDQNCLARHRTDGFAEFHRNLTLMALRRHHRGRTSPSAPTRAVTPPRRSPRLLHSAARVLYAMPACKPPAGSPPAALRRARAIHHPRPGRPAVASPSPSSPTVLAGHSASRSYGRRRAVKAQRSGRRRVC